MVARHDSPAGPWLNVTWPGAVGVLTALAPGRFAAAINQPPMRSRRLGLVGDWLLNRVSVWRSRALPPAHLLRLLMERAPHYAAARAMLAETPLAIPALFVLSGVRPGEGAVIERRETEARVHEGAVACANEWLSPDWRGRSRGGDNARRRADLARAQTAGGWSFDWLASPVLNPFTRVAVIANAAAGRLLVQGFEANGPATRQLELRPQFS